MAGTQDNHRDGEGSVRELVETLKIDKFWHWSKDESTSIRDPRTQRSYYWKRLSSLGISSLTGCFR